MAGVDNLREWISFGVVLRNVVFNPEWNSGKILIENKRSLLPISLGSGPPVVNTLICSSPSFISRQTYGFYLLLSRRPQADKTQRGYLH